MGAYWGNGGIAPRILNLGSRWRWVVSFTPRPLYLQGKSPWYPLDRKLGGPQSRSGGGGEEKNSQLLLGLELPTIRLVVQRYTTELSRLLYCGLLFKWIFVSIFFRVPRIFQENVSVGPSHLFIFESAIDLPAYVSCLYYKSETWGETRSCFSVHKERRLVTRSAVSLWNKVSTFWGPPILPYWSDISLLWCRIHYEPLNLSDSSWLLRQIGPLQGVYLYRTTGHVDMQRAEFESEVSLSNDPKMKAPTAIGHMDLYHL
jgi:hypothetical protein